MSRREKQCGDKNQYVTRKQAEGAAWNARRARLVTVRPYLCSWCGFWHIGHSRKGTR